MMQPIDVITYRELARYPILNLEQSLPTRAIITRDYAYERVFWLWEGKMSRTTRSKKT